jgi:H+-translocating NAD(P) transhydrogenase subunit alpha
MAEHASQLFARNVLALLELFVGEDSQLALNFDDEIVAGACIVRDGEIVNAGARAAVEASGATPAAGGSQ